MTREYGVIRRARGGAYGNLTDTFNANMEQCNQYKQSIQELLQVYKKEDKSVLHFRVLENIHKNSVYADWSDNNLHTVSRGDPCL